MQNATGRRVMSTIEEQAADDRGRVLANGDRLMREEESRTERGAKYTTRLIRHRKPFWYTVKAARVGGGVLGEYNASSHGNAATVFDCYLTGVFDLRTPLADLPAGLSRAMGRAWLKAEHDRCHPRAHVVGAKGCAHYSEGSEMIPGPLDWRGISRGVTQENEGGRTPTLRRTRCNGKRWAHRHPVGQPYTCYRCRKVLAGYTNVDDPLTEGG
jgi:hypothetical protein